MNSDLLKKTLLLGVVAIAFTGCYKKLNIELPYSEPQIVAESLSDNTNGYLEISLSKTMSVLDYKYLYTYNINGSSNYEESPFDTITNATVEIYRDGALYSGFENSGSSHYKSSRELTEGGDYELKVVSPSDQKTLTSSFHYPLASEISLQSYTPGLNEDDKCVIAVQDKEPGRRNYYRVKVLETTTVTGSGQTEDGSRLALFYSNSNLLTNINGEANPVLDGAETEDDKGTQYSEYAYFTDEFFDGKSSSFDLAFYQIQDFIQPGVTIIHDYHVVVETIPVELFLFLKTIQVQEYNSGDPFAQPTEIYSNIKNGLGVFALPAVRRIEID